MARSHEKDEGYQGWKNYETWAVALWIDNDRGSYDYVREMAVNARDDAESEGREPHFVFADRLKDWVEEMAEEQQVEGMFRDLLNAAISEVDWHEIAENILSE